MGEGGGGGFSLMVKKSADPVFQTVGSYHTCVILTTGDAKCFGKNPEGNLGYRPCTLNTEP